jgi:hypothetical protein
VFIGYLSSFFIAVLLSLIYLSYAISGIFVHIKKEIRNDVKVEIIEESYGAVPFDNTFVFDYIADIPVPNQRVCVSELAVNIPVFDSDIPIRKIHLSEYFLRPPPAV